MVAGSAPSCTSGFSSRGTAVGFTHQSLIISLLSYNAIVGLQTRRIVSRLAAGAARVGEIAHENHGYHHGSRAEPGRDGLPGHVHQAAVGPLGPDRGRRGGGRRG